MKENNRPLILVTNDDGANVPGIRNLIEIVKPLGDVVAIAPDEGRSGMSHAITIKYPLRIALLREEDNFIFYTCSGTPADCVKLALDRLVERKPDLLVSGINHGSNTSISIVYSGTMAAAIEGGIHGIPSLGLSVVDHSPHPEFSAAVTFGEKIIRNTLSQGLPNGVCLNVNFPAEKASEIKGVKVCRQTKGFWKEEFEHRVDPLKRDYFWLKGYFENHEPDASDTDQWAIKNNYVSVVPVNVDFSAVHAMEKIAAVYEKRIKV